MPLEWNKDQNPYKFSYFGILEVGPNTPRNQIASVGESLKKRLRNGGSHNVDNQPISANQIGEATQRLLNDETRIMEQLLVHPQSRKKKVNVDKLMSKLKKTADCSLTDGPVPLLHLLSLLWFLPPPGDEAIHWPDFDELGLVEAGSHDDLALDIIFDS